MSSSEEETWDDWVDESQDAVPVKSFFTEEILPSIQALLAHAVNKCKFDLKAYLQKNAINAKGKVDEYDTIRVVNYIRTLVKENPTKYATATEFSIEGTPWKDDQYLKPALENDPLLFSLESILGTEDYISSDDEQIPAADGKPVDAQIVALQNTIAKLKLMNQRLMESSSRKRRASRGKVTALSQPLTKSTGSGSGYESDSESDSDSGSETEQFIDDGYFMAYATFHIHEDMLKDKVRTESYRDFILNNPETFKDKVVMDIGCGTGILSMFAAKAGAKHVFAIDNSDIIERAKLIAKENGLQDKITFIKSKVEQLDKLAHGITHVDFIISEWMGYCLLFEFMLPSVVVARDRWMVKEGGSVYPDVASMHVVGISDPAYRADRVNYWNDVYGFKMTVMSENVVKEALVDVMDDTNIITNIADLHSIDINTVTVEQLDRIVCPFELTVSSEVTEPIRLDALIVYFDIHFKALALNPVYFSTGPKATPTHWKQTVLLLKDVINVAQGDVVKGEIAFSMNRASFRDLDVILNYHIVGKPEQYNQNLFVST